MRAVRNRSSSVYSCPQYAPLLERKYDRGETFADAASGKVRLAAATLVADYCRFVATGECPAEASAQARSTEDHNACRNILRGSL
jgi:hypothetical protein